MNERRARAGWRIPLTAADTLCTMRLAGQHLPGVGAKLAACCAHLGIRLDDAHCALADAFTPAECALVIQLAGLLDLADLEVAGLLAEAEARVSVVGGGLELKPGDLVVFTGMSEARKRELTAVAEARGLVVGHGVNKSVAEVIAQDPGSNSGKARKARQYGIPVVGGWGA